MTCSTATSRPLPKSAVTFRRFGVSPGSSSDDANSRCSPLARARPRPAFSRLIPLSYPGAAACAWRLAFAVGFARAAVSPDRGMHLTGAELGLHEARTCPPAVPGSMRLCTASASPPEPPIFTTPLQRPPDRLVAWLEKTARSARSVGSKSGPDRLSGGAIEELQAADIDREAMGSPVLTWRSASTRAMPSLASVSALIPSGPPHSAQASLKASASPGQAGGIRCRRCPRR